MVKLSVYIICSIGIAALQDKKMILEYALQK